MYFDYFYVVAFIWVIVLPVYGALAEHWWPESPVRRAAFVLAWWFGSPLVAALFATVLALTYRVVIENAV